MGLEVEGVVAPARAQLQDRLAAGRPHRSAVAGRSRPPRRRPPAPTQRPPAGQLAVHLRLHGPSLAGRAGLAGACPPPPGPRPGSARPGPGRAAGGVAVADGQGRLDGRRVAGAGHGPLAGVALGGPDALERSASPDWRSGPSGAGLARWPGARPWSRAGPPAASGGGSGRSAPGRGRRGRGRGRGGWPGRAGTSGRVRWPGPATAGTASAGRR